MDLEPREREILLEAVGLYVDAVNERARRALADDEVEECADDLNRCVALAVKIQIEPTAIPA